VQLYLIRHPRPAVAEGLCYGQTDLPLQESPTVAAATLRSQLPAGVPCFSSPLQRCRLLAEALYPVPLLDERLMEKHFGAWEMQPWDAISRAGLDAWAEDPWDFCPPGGESVRQLQGRVADFLRQYRHEPSMVLVTHGGVMKVLSGLAQADPLAVWQARRFDYGALVSLNLAPSLLDH